MARIARRRTPRERPVTTYGPKLAPGAQMPPRPDSAGGIFRLLYPAERSRRGAMLAAQMGPPDGHVAVSDETLIWLFELRDRSVTPQKLAEAAAQGASERDLTNLLYPHREATYTTGRPDVADQVREAERIRRLVDKRHTEEGDRPMPFPTLPPAEMPAGLTAAGAGAVGSGEQPGAPPAPPAAPSAPAPAPAPPLPAPGP